jgi:hypothetical protein
MGLGGRIRWNGERIRFVNEETEREEGEKEAGGSWHNFVPI